MATPNKSYWTDRMLALEAAEHNNASIAAEALKREYDKALQELEAKISVWYQRLAVNNEVSIEQAKQLLSGKALKEFHWDVEEYIAKGQEMALSGKWIKELENASARVHIDWLEAQKIHIEQTVQELFTKQRDNVTELVKSAYTDSYYKNSYEMQKGLNSYFNVAEIDIKKLDKVLVKPWTADGKTFSDRIWKQQNDLTNDLQTLFTQSVLTKKPPKDAINALAAKYNVAKNRAATLVYNESAAFAQMGQAEAYKALDVEYVENLCTLDSATCSTCGGMDGIVIKSSEQVMGVNVPLFHVNCRCTTVPYFDDGFAEGEMRAARDEYGNTIFVEGMKYSEWKDKYVDKPKEQRYNEFKEATYNEIKKDYPLTVNKGQQDKHIIGTNNYIEGRSTLEANPQSLIDLYAGKANPIQARNGEWSKRERFIHTDYIGECVLQNGDIIKTKSGIIHYSKKGLHIVPAKPE